MAYTHQNIRYKRGLLSF